MERDYTAREEDGIRCKGCGIMLSPEPVLEALGYCSSECERDHREVNTG